MLLYQSVLTLMLLMGSSLQTEPDRQCVCARTQTVSNGLDRTGIVAKLIRAEDGVCPPGTYEVNESH